MSSLKKKPPCRVSFELRQAARSSSCTIGGWLKRSRQCLTASMGGISRPRERSIGHIRVHSGGPETVFLTCSNEPRRPSHVPRGASACMHKPFRLSLCEASFSVRGRFQNRRLLRATRDESDVSFGSTLEPAEPLKILVRPFLGRNRGMIPSLQGFRLASSGM